MTPGSVFAKAGTKVHDVDGALVATVAEDVIYGQPVLPKHFTFAGEHLPVPGEQIPRAIMHFLLSGPHA